jgi:hypothetical protein
MLPRTYPLPTALTTLRTVKQVACDDYINMFEGYKKFLHGKRSADCLNRLAFCRVAQHWWNNNVPKQEDIDICAGCGELIEHEGYTMNDGNRIHKDTECARRYSQWWTKVARNETKKVLGVEYP